MPVPTSLPRAHKQLRTAIKKSLAVIGGPDNVRVESYVVDAIRQFYFSCSRNLPAREELMRRAQLFEPPYVSESIERECRDQEAEGCWFILRVGRDDPADEWDEAATALLTGPTGGVHLKEIRAAAKMLSKFAKMRRPLGPATGTDSLTFDEVSSKPNVCAKQSTVNGEAQAKQETRKKRKPGRKPKNPKLDAAVAAEWETGKYSDRFKMLNESKALEPLLTKEKHPARAIFQAMKRNRRKRSRSR